MVENARQILWEGLADQQWSKGQLRELQTRFQRLSLRDIQPQIQLDRVAGNEVFEMIHQRPEIVNGWGFGPSPADKARGFVIRNMPAGWMYLEQAAYQNRFEESVVPALDLNAGCLYSHKLEQAAQRGFATGLAHHRLLADLVLYSTRYLCTRAALAQVSVDEAVIACALESYRLEKGQYPAALDDLAAQGLADPPRDVITGAAMKYHPAPDGHFVLYSVGWNEKDDGGKTVPNPQTRAPDPDQGDWVWPAYPR